MSRSRTADQPSELADGIEALAFGLVAITARAIDGLRSQQSLTFQQWRILVVLGATQEGSRVSEVAARIGASRPSTSRLVHRLSERGLVHAEVDAVDRRAVRIRLTGSGATLRTAVLDARRALIEETLAGYVDDRPTSASVRQLARAFERWV